MLFESRQMLEWDINIDKQTAVKTAVKAATKAARKTRDQEIVQNALQIGMSFDDIVKLTDLTYEEIEGLKRID